MAQGNLSTVPAGGDHEGDRDPIGDVEPAGGADDDGARACALARLRDAQGSGHPISAPWAPQRLPSASRPARSGAGSTRAYRGRAPPAVGHRRRMTWMPTSAGRATQRRRGGNGWRPEPCRRCARSRRCWHVTSSPAIAPSCAKASKPAGATRSTCGGNPRVATNCGRPTTSSLTCRCCSREPSGPAGRGPPCSSTAGHGRSWGGRSPSTPRRPLSCPPSVRPSGSTPVVGRSAGVPSDLAPRLRSGVRRPGVLSQACGVLAVRLDPPPPYTPHLKGKVERLHRTIVHLVPG